ncbi:MAG: VCBS domain-containing protein [Candidatus Accumulibacter propinquus]
MVTWGDSSYGGNSSAVAAALNGAIDVTQVFSTEYAFAALRADGSVVTWGWLVGDATDETFSGGAGNDTLTGNTGDDSFVFASSGNGIDLINDFADGDRITIDGTTLILPITSGDGTALQQNQVQMSSASGVTTLHIGTDNLVGADVEIELAGEFLPSQLRVSGSSILYNHAPILATPTSADYVDSNGDDTFNAASGTFGGSDIDPDTTLSYGIAEGTVSSGVATKVGAYGTLSVNIGTGDYTFTPNDTAIEARKSNDSETFSVTVSDASATANASFTVNVTGADDPTTFSGVATATVSEDGTITAAETLTVSDRDTGDEAITPQSNAVGNYGAFGIGADGAWTYALNNAASAVQSLGIGHSLSDAFTALTAGGATQVITVTINDAPTASHRTVTTNEDTARILTVADFGFTDVDTGNTLQAVQSPPAAAGSLHPQRRRRHRQPEHHRRRPHRRQLATPRRATPTAMPTPASASRSATARRFPPAPTP